MRPDGHAVRSTNVTENLRRTVLELLLERGYAGLTIEGVVERSGIAKSTVYRRWKSKAEMVFDLAIHTAAEQPPLSDHGSLPADLRALARRVVWLVAEPPGLRILPGLLADLEADDALAQRFHDTFAVGGREELLRILGRAVDRGELTTIESVDDLHAYILGTTYAHVHVFHRKLGEGYIDKLVRHALTILRS